MYRLAQPMIDACRLSRSLNGEHGGTEIKLPEIQFLSRWTNLPKTQKEFLVKSCSTRGRLEVFHTGGDPGSFTRACVRTHRVPTESEL